MPYNQGRALTLALDGLELIMGPQLDTGSGRTTPSKADAAPPVTPSATPPLRPVPLAVLRPATPAPVEDPIRKLPEPSSK